jgi:translation initiation factor 2D
MAPGVVSIRASHTTPLPLSTNQLVCIIAYSKETNYPPMAVGRMAMSSSEVAAVDKGKAVFTLHTYGDALWEKGGKGEPPKELTYAHVQEAGTEIPLTEINSAENAQNGLEQPEENEEAENPPQAEEAQGPPQPQSTAEDETTQETHPEASG